MRLQDRPNDRRLRDAFERWRSEDPRHAEAFFRLERMMAMPSLRQASRNDAARLAAAPRLRQSARWMKYAAAAAAAIFLTVGLLEYPALMIRWQADYMTEIGEQKTVSLPDGSLLRMNAASAVALDFKDGRRKVRLLEGEVFFDIRHDPGHPFQVTAPFSYTTVRGTAFAVRAANDEDIILLERGRVQISRLSDHADKVELAPGQTVTANATSLSKVESADPGRSLAWLEGRVIYHDEPLAQALADLGRYYGSPVVIAASGIGDLRVSGSYRIDDPQAAIRTLAEVAGTSMARLPGGMIILY